MINFASFSSIMAAQNPTVNDKETTAGEIPIEVELCVDDQVKKCLESAIKHKEDHAPNTGSMGEYLF